MLQLSDSINHQQQTVKSFLLQGSSVLCVPLIADYILSFLKVSTTPKICVSLCLIFQYRENNFIAQMSIFAYIYDTYITDSIANFYSIY
jgi:hypothetical protein